MLVVRPLILLAIRFTFKLSRRGILRFSLAHVLA